MKKTDYTKYLSLSHKDINEHFIWACSEDDFELIKYLLTSPELKHHADLTYDNYAGYNNACTTGKLKYIQYFFTIPQVTNKISAFHQLGVDFSAYAEQLHVLNYLLTSEELKNQPKIDKYKDQAFKDSYFYNKKNVLEYLVLDLKIEKTEAIKQYLYEDSQLSHQKYPRYSEYLSYVNNLFTLREYQALNESVPNKELKERKPKL